MSTLSREPEEGGGKSPGYNRYLIARTLSFILSVFFSARIATAVSRASISGR
ncbi:MAG: hypothetical protein LBT13_05385 [Treponema sp.]|nr:hypothetical protein [Treponema sp.]